MSQYLSATDHLLVPINVQAAVINEKAINTFAWSTDAVDYTNLSTFQTASPGPFGTNAPSKPGIHLLWELPGAFRHGTHNPNQHEAPDYPCAPNRWLVVRFWPGATDNDRKSKAWILSSDATGGTSPYVNTQANPTDSWETKFGSTNAPHNIGSSQELSTWAGESGTEAAAFLKAIGPGMMTYSAFTPNVENVFSLVDDGTDNNGNDLISTKPFSISSATGTTVIIEWDNASKLTNPFTQNQQFVIEHDTGWHGPFTTKLPAAVGTNQLTITTNNPVVSGATWTTGSVIPVGTSYNIVSVTANSITIGSSTALDAQFPPTSEFFVTGSGGNDNYYRVLGTSFDSTNDQFTINVDGTGKITNTSDTSGTLSSSSTLEVLNFDYLVMGWYSPNGEDPLAKPDHLANWAAQLNAMNWFTPKGPYLVSSVHTNSHKGTSELWIKGMGNLTTQFTVGATITVVGLQSGNTTFTLGTPSYHLATQTMVLPLATTLSDPGPGEHLYIIPGDISTLSFPQNSMLHGQLNMVNWQGNQAPQRANSHSSEVSDNVKVAVGNSSIEALSAAFVSQQQSDLEKSGITKAQQYRGTISGQGAPIAISSDVDLTDSWFPVGSSIVLTNPSSTHPNQPLGTFRVAGTYFDKKSPEPSSVFYIYLADNSASSSLGTSVPTVTVTPTYLDTDLMDAFQTNQLSLLEEAGGRTKLDIALEKENFRPEKGGTLWKLESIKGKPLFDFAIAKALTGSSPGFTIDMSGFSESTVSGMANLFADNTHFEVSDSKGSSSGKYKVLSNSTSGNTFTIVTTATPPSQEEANNTIKVAANADVLPIGYKVTQSTNTDIDVYSPVDLSSRFPAEATFQVTGPNTSSGTTYTVSGSSYDSSTGIFTISASNPPNGGFTFTSANRVDLNTTSLESQLGQWIANVNIVQNNLDRETRVLRSLQSECYALWYQTNFQELNQDGIESDATKEKIVGLKKRLGALQQRLVKQLETVQSWEARLNTTINDLGGNKALVTTKQLPELAAYWQLKATLKPRFYQPSDPELLMSGLDSSFDIARSSAPNTSLPCRFTSDLVAQFSVNTSAGTVIIKASDITTSDLAIPTNGNFSSAQQSLLSALSYEAFFLNMGNVALLAQIGGIAAKDSNKILQAIQQQQGYLDSAGNAAVLPLSLAVQQWQQAWMPLYLDWKVNWLPTQAATANSEDLDWSNWYFDQAAWQFDGKGYNFNTAPPVKKHLFTTSASLKICTYTNPGIDLLINSNIPNNFLIDENGNHYSIEGRSNKKGVLKITCPTNLPAHKFQASFQFTIDRQAFSLNQDTTSSSTSFEVIVSPQNYVKFRSNSQMVCVYKAPDSFDTFQVGVVSYDSQTQLMTLGLANEATVGATYTEQDLLYPIITYSGAAPVQGRTFVTPEATFNFRSRLEQYISSHQGTSTANHLADVEHILDIIGGMDFQILEAGFNGNTFVVASDIDLDHLFTVGSKCYVSQSENNNNGYTVDSVSMSDGRVTITVNESVNTGNNGILTPTPHQWDLMSQTLTGFTDQMILRSQQSNVSPGGPPAILAPATSGSSGGSNFKYEVTSYSSGTGFGEENGHYKVTVPTGFKGSYPIGSPFYILHKGNPVIKYSSSKQAELTGTTLELYFTPSTSYPEGPGEFSNYNHWHLVSGEGEHTAPKLSKADFDTPPWYALIAGSGTANTFYFESDDDISYLFPENEPCYFANKSTPTPYQLQACTVASCKYTSGTMEVTVNETIVNSSVGFLGPDMATLIGGHHLGYPMINTADEVNNTSSAAYFPIRGGFFEFQQLQVVDRFGQQIDLIKANNNTSTGQFAWENFKPIKSRSLTPGPDSDMIYQSRRLAELAPRIVTPSRLNFDFVDGSGGANDKIDIDLLPKPKPVCGWLLPNHIDGGVSVYNAEGDLLGELLLSTIPDQAPEVAWYPAGVAQPKQLSALKPTDIANPYLLNMLQGLDSDHQTAPGQAFQNFLQAIDETLWAVDEASTHSDQHMALLLGRPLALVRGRLKFTLQGHADYGQKTEYYQTPDSFASWTANPAASVSPVGQATITISDSSWTNDNAESLVATLNANRTLSISGDSKNAGVYHLLNAVATPEGTGFSITVNLLENLVDNDTSGELRLDPPSGDTTSLEWPVRLGLADLYDDGLIGYFNDDQGFGQLNCVHKPIDMIDAGYLKAIGGEDENYLPMKFHPEVSHGVAPLTVPVVTPEAGATFVTMLMDPRAAVHATTGLLPTSTVELPPQFTQKAMETMNVTFRVGPLLTNPMKIQMPLPNVPHGDWGWLEANSQGSMAIPASVMKGGQMAELPNKPLTLRDGWLALKDFEREKSNN